MGLGFDNFSERGGYLKQAGLHTGATFRGLTYTANEKWEGFDIEIETADGKLFRERTFGADINKVYPRDKYENGQKVGKETVQEAYDRVQEEISKKLYYLGLCFCKADVLKEKVKNARDLKEFVKKVNEAIAGNTDRKINFLTIWKNSPSKQKSNLILADRGKWCETTKYNGEEVLAAGISLTPYQVANNMKEEFPYRAANESTNSSESFVSAEDTSDLPF